MARKGYLPGELTKKDMSLYKEADGVKAQKERRQGELKDYSFKHQVWIRWDLNDEAVQDQVFELRIDDKVVLLDAEQVLRYLRWV